MPVPRVAVAVALAGAVLVLPGPPAAADPVDAGPSNIVVVPAAVEQGAIVTITVDGTACRGIGRMYDAIVESNAFPRTQLTGLPDRRKTSAARPTVFAAAEPGTHTVSATCGGRTITGGHFRVVPPRNASAAPGTGAGSGTATAGSAAPSSPAGSATAPGTGSSPGTGSGTTGTDSGTGTGTSAAPHHPGAAPSGRTEAGPRDSARPDPGRTRHPAPGASAGAVPDSAANAGVGSADRSTPFGVALGGGLVMVSAAIVGYCLVRRLRRSG
ncbi:hypothetical protein ACFYYR_05270 [Streptomyces sp. NPDC001922]|uniref:hypothetical protein n=1 Tax=Streptomyces sp. NPDC001922 TaxID=3364624 RepID=UPI0036B766A5